MLVVMNAIRAYRKHLGMSQFTFGKLVGIPQTTISSYEQGIRSPSHHVVKRIEAATNGRLTRYQLRPDVFGAAPAEDRAA